jgi:hypothetical protein
MADDAQALEWEITDYLFQHDYNRVEQAAKRLEGKLLSFRVEFKEGKELRSNLEVPDETAAMEFAIAMSHFLRSESPRRAEAWIDFLDEIAGPSHKEFFSQASQALDRAKEGFLPIIINGRRIRNEEVYNTLATNVVFADDMTAHEYLKGLQRDPLMGNLLWMTYYNHCVDVWDVLRWVMEYRKSNGIYPPKIARENQCIYCKRGTGSFSRFDHIVPESLGNETSLLPPGFVCDDCNEALGRIEGRMVAGLPFKLLRPYLLWENKKARLPRAKFRDAHIERVSPNRVNFKSMTKKSVLREERLPDGRVKFTLDVKESFDVHALARGLMKIGLGVIALENGREKALDPKYDLARNYVLKGGTFPNKMLMAKENTPQPGGMMQWVHTAGGGAGMVIQLLGLTFVIALSEKPAVQAEGPLVGQFLAFDLRQVKPRAEEAS